MRQVTDKNLLLYDVKTNAQIVCPMSMAEASRVGGCYINCAWLTLSPTGTIQYAMCKSRIIGEIVEAPE